MEEINQYNIILSLDDCTEIISESGSDTTNENTKDSSNILYFNDPDRTTPIDIKLNSYGIPPPCLYIDLFGNEYMKLTEIEEYNSRILTHRNTTPKNNNTKQSTFSINNMLNKGKKFNFETYKHEICEKYKRYTNGQELSPNEVMIIFNIYINKHFNTIDYTIKYYLRQREKYFTS